MNQPFIALWVLFAVTLFLQIVAIGVRQVFVSLFFSFLHSIFISIILMAMGHLWLSIANLWFSSGLTYFALIKTALLLGSYRNPKPQRRISFSLITFGVIVLSFTSVVVLLMPFFPDPIHLSDSSLQHQIRSVLQARQGLVILTLALMALSALVNVYLLVRRDDVMEG